METAGKDLDDEELVRLMKGSGIGTPATRAAIIERLIKVGYAARRGKTLNATDKGVMLIDIMPPEIASPETTGRWELALHEITDGKQDAARFMDGIRKMSAFLVNPGVMISMSRCPSRRTETGSTLPAGPGGKVLSSQERCVPSAERAGCGKIQQPSDARRTPAGAQSGKTA